MRIAGGEILRESGDGVGGTCRQIEGITMPASTGDQTNSHTDAVFGNARRRIMACSAVACAAAVLIIAAVAWNASGSSRHVVSVAAANTNAAVASAPAFCPSARAYVDKLPVLQTSLTDQAKLPGLLTSAASGVSASISSAPADVQADVATISKAIGDFQTAIGAASNQLSKLPPQQALALQTPTVSQAISRLVDYVNTTCGAP